DASCTSKIKCLQCGRPHSADSAECQLWQRERRLATIKASAPTYLPHREAQAALRSSPTGTGGPHLNQAPGKSYAAVVGAPSTVVVNSTHPRQPVYVRRELPHAHTDVTDVTGGALECCAVTVRFNGVDTTVASVYVRPGQRWNSTELLHLTSRLGSDFLLCGDMNAHHTMWGSRTCSSRGSELVYVIHQLGLQVLNTGSFTFVHRTCRPSCSAIDISLASEGARYDWATQPDSWGSDHLPITIKPVGGKIRRTRQCTTIDWRAFRQRLREAPVDQDFLGLVAAAAQAATIQCRVPENHPVPDLRHLNLRAARRKAERRYLKAQSAEHRTLFNRVDAVCRRHANRRRRQSWQGICHSLSWARGGSRAWRLLRSLVIRPMARQPVLSVAIRLGISEQELAERLADRFTEHEPHTSQRQMGGCDRLLAGEKEITVTNVSKN
ncbi:hypothetical protein MTO96_011286, partial [Rhipicephalus appendiculatus]